MSEDDKACVVMRSSGNMYVYIGVAYVGVGCKYSAPYKESGLHATFRSYELADYAGKQFVDIYADFV